MTFWGFLLKPLAVAILMKNFDKKGLFEGSLAVHDRD